jgi:hypothetical protein
MKQKEEIKEEPPAMIKKEVERKAPPMEKIIEKSIDKP